MIIYRGLSLLQTKCLWDRLTASETSFSDSCIWHFFITSRRVCLTVWPIIPICTIHGIGTTKRQRCWTKLREVVWCSQEESRLLPFHSTFRCGFFQSNYKVFWLGTWSDNTSDNTSGFKWVLFLHNIALSHPSRFVWSWLSFSLSDFTQQFVRSVWIWKQIAKNFPLPESTWK